MTDIKHTPAANSGLVEQIAAQRPRTLMSRVGLDDLDHEAKYLPSGINPEITRLLQALHAGISRRDWHDTEVAANTLRDLFEGRRRARLSISKTPESDVTIPENVWTIADGVWLELANLGETAVSRREAEAEIIARAILAERERCAGIAEMHDHRGDISTAIRRSA